MNLSKVPKTKPISAKKAARYNKIFNDRQKMKEIFEQAEASSRWAEELMINERASQCTKPGGNINGEEDNDVEEEEEEKEEEEEEEEEELVAPKYFNKEVVMNSKEQEKEIEEFGVGDDISNSLVLRKQEEGLVLPNKDATAKTIPTTEFGTSNVAA
ncbi:hypothetical protein BOTNAR_0534g00010 [Botryotinia narcissicola]|uniref:Uncharacterized protein n=1 Tax=Botryotinia narcissicola TaxID=278944 RepID=A0A4Z1HE12_9HELO|nr:hypothetical protein BOTNAR_0534g00010 [Botryotinia narcissicola]